MDGQFPVSDFDGWAEYYDRSVWDQKDYPFSGYKDVLAMIFTLAGARPGKLVLDLGTGTGNLALPFDQTGCDLWCTDFSEPMLARARQKIPGAKFFLHDLRTPFPPEFNHPFDCIISAYVFHHFELSEKVRIIQLLAAQHLAPAGFILIGDIAFQDQAALEAVKTAVGDQWDDEYYWIADQAIPALEEIGLKIAYSQVSSCAGVFAIQRR